MTNSLRLFCFLILLSLILTVSGWGVELPEISPISRETVKTVIHNLIKTHGETHCFRIERGINRTASFWRLRDGSEEDFKTFCKTHFIADKTLLDETLKRLERNFEAIKGNFYRISHTFLGPLELPSLKKLPVDRLFLAYWPDAHMQEDLFRAKVAFAVILNFPHYSLEEKEKLGGKWSRLQWAMANAGDLFTSRVPAEINGKLADFGAEIDEYFSSYHLYPGNLLGRDNKTLFEIKEKKIFHWGPRDMIQAAYHRPGAEEKQDLIYRAMLRVIDQTVPAKVISNPDVLWSPYTNKVYKKEKGKKSDSKIGNLVPVVSSSEGFEGGKRYEFILRNFRAQALLDPYYPGMSSEIDRQFRLQRRMPEEVVERVLKQLLTSPQAVRLGKWLEKKIERKLKPYDLFYDGFLAGAQRDMAPIDKLLAKKYPDVHAFQADMPGILRRIGFPAEMADAVTGKILVQQTDAVPHGGWREMKDDVSYVRIPVPSGGMDYKTYHMALHEYGHDMQLALSLDGMDYYFLKDLPADAFSESFAMILEVQANWLLGIKEDRQTEDMKVLRAFWRAYTNSGPALLEMKMWHWMYDHPEASVSQFQAASLRMAKEIWNTYYAPVFHEKDVPLLLVYTHLVRGVLYFAEYPMGEAIAFQIKEYFKKKRGDKSGDKSIGREIIRMCRIGALTPDLWMQKAVSSDISVLPLQNAIREVLKRNQ